MTRKRKRERDTPEKKYRYHREKMKMCYQHPDTIEYHERLAMKAFLEMFGFEVIEIFWADEDVEEGTEE